MVARRKNTNKKIKKYIKSKVRNKYTKKNLGKKLIKKLIKKGFNMVVEKNLKNLKEVVEVDTFLAIH